MAHNEIICQKIDGLLYAALLRDKRVFDLYTDGAEHVRWASIYLGKVIRVDKNLNGAFIALGGTQTGFLPAKHVVKNGESRRDVPISSSLSPGEMVIVQVKAEGRAASTVENRKYPRLTMKIYLPGRQLFFNPYGASGISFAESPQDENLQKFSETLKKYGGWHLHCAPIGLNLEYLKNEAKALIVRWREMTEAVQKSSENPRMLEIGPNAPQRLLIDYPALSINHIELAEDANTALLAAWLKTHAPPLAESLAVSPAHQIDLFEMRDIYGVIEEAQDIFVPLPSGGSILVDQTHAMVVIDVNQGDGGDIVSVNKEAAVETARQIRLRNLSGAILIDFINMRTKSERYELLRTLEHALDRDPGNAVVHGFTRLGIVEITRTRRTATLSEKTAN